MQNSCIVSCMTWLRGNVLATAGPLYARALHKLKTYEAVSRICRCVFPCRQSRAVMGTYMSLKNISAWLMYPEDLQLTNLGPGVKSSSQGAGTFHSSWEASQASERLLRSTTLQLVLLSPGHTSYQSHPQKDATVPIGLGSCCQMFRDSLHVALDDSLRLLLFSKILRMASAAPRKVDALLNRTQERSATSGDS